ncbi:hypothetical protein ACP70R_025228 [Stipagrostis hirtigluma subsp. patula]
MVSGEDYYYDSDSDSDDDVDRYVFLARQPAPARRHASSDDDGDDDVTADEGDGGGRRGRKRPLREGFDAPPPSSKSKKARFDPIAPPLAPALGSGSESASSLSGVRDREEAPARCVATAHGEGALRSEGETKKRTRKQGVCGKRSRGPESKEDGDREPIPAVTVAAAKTGTSSAASSGQFLCNLCDRCFDSHQALGGHVLGHRKKAKIALAAAAASHAAAADISNCKELMAVLAVSQEAADAIGHAGKMVVDDIEARQDDVDSSGHSKAEKASVAPEDHNGADGDGSSGDSRETVIGANHEGGNGNYGIGSETTAIVVSGHGFTNGNGNVCRMQYKCKVCGTECPTGRALGGHMRKHRKMPARGGDGDGEGTKDRESQTPIARLFGKEICLQRALVIKGEEPADMVRTF